MTKMQITAVLKISLPLNSENKNNLLQEDN